jgi:hypothetical protein
MKWHKLLAVMAFVVLSILAINAWGYEYDGPIDPAEFQGWPAVASRPMVVQDKLLIEIIIENPDKEAAVKAARVLIHSETNGIVAYAYAIGGEMRFFAWDNENQIYKQVEPVKPVKYNI